MVRLSLYWLMIRECLLSFSAESLVSKFAIHKYNGQNMQSYNLPYCFVGEILSLKLRYEHRLRVFEDRVLRKIFGHKRDELTGKWRRFHKRVLLSAPITKYSSGN